MGTPGDRRQLKTRDSRWANWLAHDLARRGVSPNTISLGSIVCAGLACVSLLLTRSTGHPWPRVVFLLIAAAGIQLRLMCNLLDGMVAVEAGAGVGRFGEIYNDAPDRLADILIFVGAGLAAGGVQGPILGLFAALGCLLTAYVRVLGKSMGARSHFEGPMAKQHRMAVMTAGCLVACVLVFRRDIHVWMRVPLYVVCLGCVATVVNRLRLIVRDLGAA